MNQGRLKTIFVHETCRVYRDRISLTDDINIFNNILIEKLSTILKVDFSQSKINDI